MNEETTLQSVDQKIDTVLEALQVFSNSVDERFASMDKRFDGVDQRFESMDQRFESMDQRFESLENTMEQGFADLRGELRDVRRELDRINLRLESLDKRTMEDSGAHTKEVIELRSRVAILEEKFAKLEKQPA